LPFTHQFLSIVSHTLQLGVQFFERGLVLLLLPLLGLFLRARGLTHGRNLALNCECASLGLELAKAQRVREKGTCKDDENGNRRQENCFGDLNATWSENYIKQ
jgi:hypothetical protein